MYEQHLGFKRRPFRAVSTGADVFVGPQTAKIMQATKLAMPMGDAVVAVMGPAGVGKTTIVNRAMDAIDGEKLVIRIARMQLGHDEVLDFLLDELQATNVPASTIRKVTLFRRLLAERNSAGVRVVIVLEDAVRIGDDALAELEALTAADGLGSDGACLVLMGELALRDRLDADALTRLKQRVRAYQFVKPLVAPELLGYLKHCFRLAGGEFDLIFDAQAASFIHALTGGVPRTTNNVVQSVLNAAATRKLNKIDNPFIATIAKQEFGLTAEIPPPVAKPAPAPVAKPEPGPVAKPEPVPAKPEPATVIKSEPATVANREPRPEVKSKPEIAARPIVEHEPATEAESKIPDVVAAVAEPEIPELVREPEPELKAVSEAAPLLDPEPVADDIPELIHDTLPNLTILAPELTIGAESSGEDSDAPIPTLTETKHDALPEILAVAEPDTPNLPELEPLQDPAPIEPSNKPETEMRQEVVKPDPTPEPEPEQEPAQEPVRDPTLAQLKPDFDVLEQAMAGMVDADEHAPEAIEEPEAPIVEEEDREPTLPSLPTITLDAAIQENINEATAALQKHDATIADDTVSEESSDIAAAAPKKPAANSMSDTDIKKIASGIRKARSLEDMDERMAETLFGAEFSAIAAQVIANPPPGESANQDILLDADEAAGNSKRVPDEAELIQELSLVEESFAAKPKNQATPPVSAPTFDEPSTEMEKEFLEVYGENALEVSLETDTPNPGMDLSASQRLATVRALNAEHLPASARPPKPSPSAAQGNAKPSQEPQSIEDQITTSMTATLKALSVRPDSANDEDEVEEPKRGFFSRFRRS